MDRKNINRGFKKLGVWQDAISLYVLACKIFTNFPFELKKVASNSPAAGFGNAMIAMKEWLSPEPIKNIHGQVVKACS